MINFGPVPASSVLPVIFDTFAGSTGAPITMTNFAIGDVQIYKGTSMTQRSSTAGIVLIDTDGVDIDGITGIQGVSIDLSDNTDSGFYAVGSFFTVVISTVTVDAQTLSFVAASFRIMAAEATAGYPATTSKVGTGTGEINLSSGLVPIQSGTGTGQLDFTSGVVKANLAQILGTALTETAGQIAAAFKQFFDVASPTGTMKAITAVGTLTTYTGNTPQTGDAYARIGANGVSLSAIPDEAGVTTLLSRLSAQRATNLDGLRSYSGTASAGASTSITLSGAVATDSYYNNQLVAITGGTGAGQARFITAYVGSTKVATVAAWATNPDNTSTFIVIPFDAVAGASAPTVAQIATGIWQDLLSSSDFSTSASVGKLLKDDIDAAVSSRMATFSTPTNFSSLSIDSSGRVNAFLIGILTSVFTEGATGRVAAAFKQFFNIASPTSTMNEITLVDTTTTLTNAPSDSAGVTTLLTRLSAARAGYLDNLSAGAAALEASLQGLITTVGAAGAGLTSVALTSAYNFAKGTVAMTESYAALHAAPTPVQALFAVVQKLFERSVTGTTETINGVDGSTPQMTETLNDSSSPTAVTRAT